MRPFTDFLSKSHYQILKSNSLITSPQYSLIKSFLGISYLENIPHPAMSEGARSKCCNKHLILNYFINATVLHYHYVLLTTMPYLFNASLYRNIFTTWICVIIKFSCKIYMELRLVCHFVL